jgi:hypothetical protein
MALSMDWDQDARDELRQLPAAERRAVMTAVAKLEAFGDRLGAPHSSQVKGSQAGIRSYGLGPGTRPGGCYRRLGGAMVILAVGPEAEHDRRGFDRAVRLAEDRLKEIEG